MRVLHFLNQFFAGFGGEEAADAVPFRLEGPAGPGRALAAAGLEPDVTIGCGDDYFGQHESAALATLLGWIGEFAPDVVICGPSFGSGRYGYACGVLAREVGRRGIPVVSAMTPDSPGVLASEGAAYIIPSTANVAGMRSVVPTIVSIAARLASGAEVGSAEEEGYLPRNLRRNVRAGRTGAARAIELALGKLQGNVATEIDPPATSVPVPAPITDLPGATIALVTEAGCVPQGNPDRLSTRHANAWLRYPLSGVASMSADRYETVHAGFDTTAANEDPNRLVPLDAVRELERAGKVGRLHDVFYTTSGVDTPVATAAKFGKEIVAELIEAKVGAVILTGT